MDETITDMPEHHCIHYFALDATYYDAHADDLEAALQDLNELFSSAGILLTAEEGSLKIDVNEEKYQSVTKRKAGRKKNDVGKRYEEIMEYRETHTAQETFEWLGLTKQTYYRKLKQHQDNNDDGSVEF